MKEHAVFADLAPRFHLLAEDILQRQIHLVIYNLKEVLPLLKCMQHHAASVGYDLVAVNTCLPDPVIQIFAHVL
jgi:hypothetical protein